MKLLFRTTNQEEAEQAQKQAQKQYGAMAVYRFQYRSKDGNFYYEILLNENWL